MSKRAPQLGQLCAGQNPLAATTRSRSIRLHIFGGASNGGGVQSSDADHNTAIEAKLKIEAELKILGQRRWGSRPWRVRPQNLRSSAEAVMAKVQPAATAKSHQDQTHDRS